MFLDVKLPTGTRVQMNRPAAHALMRELERQGTPGKGAQRLREALSAAFTVEPLTPEEEGEEHVVHMGLQLF